MIRPISVVDWEACRLGYDRDPLVFAFKEVGVDVGEVPEEVLKLYDSAFAMQKGYEKPQAAETYRKVEELAEACGNPVLRLMAQHQRVFCTTSGHMLSRELSLLLSYIPTVQEEELNEASAQAMRLTVSLQAFADLVFSNHLLVKAQEEGRYATARLSVIEEMIAEGSYERAEYFARESSRVLAEKLGENHWWRAVLLLKQAECLKALNKIQEARTVLRVCDMIFAEWCCSEEHLLAGFVRRFVVLSRSVGT